MGGRIETKTSRTAEFTCMIRYQSYQEKREYYKSDDYVTPAIINSMAKFLLRLPPVNRYFINSIYAAGMYEYVIARTKYIDGEFRKALGEGIEQVLIMGAGFDSRGVRFSGISGDTVIYELDAPVTQTVKINRYKEKGIEIPVNLKFIPIDFNRQSLPERLDESGFGRGKKSLFLLEGLTMYLEPESVDETFKVIQEYAGEGSKVVFDHIYASVLRKENLYEGEKELYQSVLKRGEGFRFGIEKGCMNEFLAGYGFKTLNIMDSGSLENMFFKDGQGKAVGRVNGTHCIVTAAKEES